MKYIPSIAFEEMSGSAKGVTAAKMKSRKYIRNRGYGGSVRASDQAKVKGIFKQLTSQWKSLTPAQILAWNKLALSQEGRSVLGTKAKISGSNLFTRLNYWIVACGGTALVNPPALVGVESPSSATVMASGSVMTFKLDQDLHDNGGIFLVIEASEGQSNGVSRAHNKAVSIKMVEEPSDAVIDIAADYIAKHGAPNAGAPKIFFRYYFVNSATGEKSGTMLAEVKWTADGENSGGGGSASQGGSQAATVEAPVISGNETFSDSTQVTITGPSGAEIRYTTDGSVPSASSSLYSAPFSLTNSATVKAIAIKDGVSSEVASKTFTKNGTDPDGFNP